MSISDYASLKTTISSYLHRSDLNANIADFVQMAEWRIARDLRITPLINTSTVILTGTGANSVSLPSGFLEMVDVSIQANNNELHYIPPDHIDRILSKSPATGTPWVYTLRGNNILVAPAATATVTLSCSFYKKEDALNDTSASSWVATNAPDVFLYASLLEASPFIVNDERIPVWQGFYNNAVDRLNQQYGVLDPHKRMQRGSLITPKNPGSTSIQEK